MCLSTTDTAKPGRHHDENRFSRGTAIGVGRLDRGVALIGATDGRRIRGPME